MPRFAIECETEGREVYVIDAPTIEAAEHVLYHDAPEPVISEVLSFTIRNSKDITDGG